MADVYTRIGYIKGGTGATGAQGAKGDTGDAATIQVGSVTTVPYGQTANVVNSGTEQAAIFDFTIPQGRPGQQTTEMDDLLLNSITTSSASFPIPAIGETGKVLWGKVIKWFSDMSALVATKLNTANVVNNLTTTASGYALDARMGKKLAEFSEGTVSTQYFQEACEYYKVGNCVCISVIGSSTAISASTGYYTLFTLGEGYRPHKNLLVLGTDSTGTHNAVIQIQPSGAVRLYNFNKNIPNGTQYRFLITYPVQL